MKKRSAFMCLLALLGAPVLHAQDAPASLPDVDSVASDWKARFPDAAERRDFKRLREYREEKLNRLKLEQSTLANVHLIRQQVERERMTRATLEPLLKDALALAADTAGVVVIEHEYPFEFDNLVGHPTPGRVPLADLQGAAERLAQQDSGAQRTLAAVDSVSGVLTASIRTLQQDIHSAESTIDNALAPEYQSQKFRIWVSLFFSLLIGIMIVSFFGTIYKKAGDSVGTLLLSDGGLQFVTIFVLIIAIILFGILNILEGRELAAILSGIAGYILGRGAQVKTQGSAGDAPQPQPEPAAPANDTPPAGPTAVRVPSIFLPPAPPARTETPPARDVTPPSESPAESPQPAAVG